MLHRAMPRNAARTSKCRCRATGSLLQKSLRRVLGALKGSPIADMPGVGPFRGMVAYFEPLAGVRTDFLQQAARFPALTA